MIAAAITQASAPIAAAKANEGAAQTRARRQGRGPQPEAKAQTPSDAMPEVAKPE